MRACSLIPAIVVFSYIWKVPNFVILHGPELGPATSARGGFITSVFVTHFQFPASKLRLCHTFLSCLIMNLPAVGHGQSEGDRVHVEDFHEYVRDTFQHFDKVAQQFPAVPRFVIGHSMVRWILF